MDSEDAKLLATLPFAAASLIFVGAVFGELAARDRAKAQMQRRAVEHGAAEWVVHEDGEVFFRWVEE